MDRTRAAGGVLAAGSSAFVIAVIVASQTPGPRAWGLHLPGFLLGPERWLVTALLVAGAALLVLDFVAPRARDHPSRRSSKRPRSLRLPRWTGWLLLVPWCFLLFRLAIRTQLLGDAQVWMDHIRADHPEEYTEPLAAAVWALFSRILEALRFPVDPATMAPLPVFCGLVAGVLLWGIAGEITSGSRALALALLATMGVAQLYFGYIESYPTVSVVILAYLWLGLRHARGADHPAWLTIALAVAIASHLACLYLVPSFLFLTSREPRPWGVRAGMACAPLAGAAALLLLLGSSPSRWVESFRVAVSSVRAGHDASVFAKPYGLISLDHASDVGNAILLVLPVPLLLLVAALASGPSRRPEPDSAFLAISAIPGVALAAALLLPVAPAQDWDLFSILLLPLGVLGVQTGVSRIPIRGRRAWGLASLGAGTLLAFVLVNANERSSLRRYETLLGPGAKVTAFARAYGNELLCTEDFERNDNEAAAVHARRALEAEPTNPRYWIKTGVALDRLGRTAEAIPVLEEAVRRGPERPDSYFYLGNALYEVRRYPEAVACYRNAVHRSVPRPDYLYNLGVALYFSGQPDSARALWTDVVRRWPSFTEASRTLNVAFGTAP